MSTTNPVLIAAAPSLIAAIKAIQQFETDMGTNIAQWPVTIPAAKLKLLGALGLLLPGLETSEVSALGTIINTTTSGWIMKLEALTPATTSATTAAEA
jgi:hypothetical protein